MVPATGVIVHWSVMSSVVSSLYVAITMSPARLSASPAVYVVFVGGAETDIPVGNFVFPPPYAALGINAMLAPPRGASLYGDTPPGRFFESF